MLVSCQWSGMVTYAGANLFIYLQFIFWTTTKNFVLHLVVDANCTVLHIQCFGFMNKAHLSQNLILLPVVTTNIDYTTLLKINKLTLSYEIMKNVKNLNTSTHVQEIMCITRWFKTILHSKRKLCCCLQNSRGFLEVLGLGKGIRNWTGQTVARENSKC